MELFFIWTPHKMRLAPEVTCFHFFFAFYINVTVKSSLLCQNARLTATRKELGRHAVALRFSVVSPVAVPSFAGCFH